MTRKIVGRVVVASWELCMSDKEDIIDSGFVVIGDSKCFTCIALQ